MFSNLFKPKWLHHDAKVRTQALTTLAGDSVELIKLAQTDPDSGVRIEAVMRLHHLPTLVQLGHTSGSIAERARQRVIGLAATNHHHDALLADVFPWLQGNPALLRSISRDTSRGVKLRRHAIEALPDQALLFEIANNGSSKEMQFLAASRLTDMEQLKALEKAHGKANKRLRLLFKERQEAEQQQQQAQVQLETLCAEAAALGKANNTWEQDKTRAKVLVQRWKTVERQANPEQQQRFSAAHDDFQQRLGAYEAEQAIAAQHAAEQARLAAEAQQAAEAARLAEQERLERVQQAEAEERLHRKQQQQQLEARLQSLRAELDGLEASLEAETYGEAIDKHHTFTQLLKESTDLPARELAFFHRRLQMLTPFIREVQDWRRWGTDQARKQLIETAENLRTDQEIDPQQRAKAVQALRDDWRKLAQMEPGQQRAQWKEFDTTVSAAYEPVKQHRSEQAQQREVSLAERAGICARLEALDTETDWDNVDWRAQQALVNQCRKQWKEAGTVTHKDWDAINPRFNAAMDAVEAHFKAERERNWQARTELAAHAAALLENPDTEAAIEQAKELQTYWDVTLASRSADEQRLWKQFRDPIDALFARAKEERNQQRNEHKAGLAAAEAERVEAEQRALLRQQQKQAELDKLGAQSVALKQQAADPDTLAANQAAGERLCLQLEILLDLETPAAFQKARMEYQVAQLSESMRTRKELLNPAEQAPPLLKQWYALGAMPDGALASQAGRIGRARGAL